MLADVQAEGTTCKNLEMGTTLALLGTERKVCNSIFETWFWIQMGYLSGDFLE